MNQNIKVSIIVVHWNTPSELKVQISLLRQGFEGQAKFKVQNYIEVIVVDNASSKDIVKKIKSYMFQVTSFKFIFNKSNVGFATANNQGASIAQGEWLLFLNPDTHITSENILKFVKQAELQNLDAASLQPASENYAKPIPTPFSLLVEFSPLHRIIPLSIFKKKTLFGGGLLIKKRVFQQLNGWDERFFLWFEDSDISKRLFDEGFKTGWINIPHTHKGGTSFSLLTDKKRKDIFFQSMNLYASKHFNFIGKITVKFIQFLNT